MKNPRQMPPPRRWGALLAVLGLLGIVQTVSGQGLPTLKDDFRNVYRIPGAGRPWPPTPAVNDPLPATANQFKSGSAFGSFSLGSSTNQVTPIVTGQPVYGQNADGSVKLRSASFSRQVVLQTAQFQFGEIIPPPTQDTSGNPLLVLTKPKNWPFTLDGSGNPTATAQTDFYYSADAGAVFASKAGVVNIVWETAALPRTPVPRTYVVSSSPVKTPRTMYWTEQGYKAPTISVPQGRVDLLRFAYNPRFPQSVDGMPGFPYPSPHVPPPGDPNTQLPEENRTAWFDNNDQAIHAYNWEGRILIEYLGPQRDASGLRTHLGTEIIEVVREIAPTLVRVDIGQPLPPLPNLAVGAEDLTANFVAGLQLVAQPFVFQHLSQGGTKSTYYAIRTTTPTVVAGNVEVLSNEVLSYWLEAGLRGIRWPKYYAGYIISWPGDDAKYSLYARPDKATETPVDTAIQLNSVDNPQLVFQDDPTQQQAQINELNQFFSGLTGDEENRALIQYTNGDQVWFELVKSKPVSSFPGYGTLATASVGARLEPPPAAMAAAYDDGDGDTANDVFVGYLHEKRNATGAAARDYDPADYKDPFLVGFDEAKKGVIIGVNARPGKDTLEVWWFRRSQPTASRITGTYWPSYVQRYQLQWPADSDKIVLASNAGSGDLGLAGGGSIYYQNNANLPGYNPNEEHALMLQGRAWALRDDLNVKDAQGHYTSSAPFVLVRYLETDLRPAMRIFHVLREDGTTIFDYPAVAGTPLGLPKPLGDIPLARNAQGRTLNVEVPTAPDLPTGFTDADPFKLYKSFTFIDRKQAHWIYRGKHDGGAGQLIMRYQYPTQIGFYFPDKGNNQPPVGTPVPFLRPLDASGNAVGDSVTGTPLNVVYRPQWPSSAPVLNLGETLTSARAGLPQIRGASSVEVLYQQSVANTFDTEKKQSIRLYDPTVAKKSTLPNGVPSSIPVSSYLGRFYFPSLPPHLSQRLYFIPTAPTGGAQSAGTLIFTGEFRDEALGDDYLLPNVMSDKDVADAKNLCPSIDSLRTTWNGYIDGLSTQLTTYTESPQLPGNYQVLDNVGFGPISPVEVTRNSTSDTSGAANKPIGSAVDSYAIAAIDGGEGFVVVATGNGNGKFQEQGEPVSVQVFRVGRPLGSGALKVITTANPLDEKVTLQDSLDFAGKAQNFEIQFLYAPPDGGGNAPPIYTTERNLILGDGAWRLLQNPPADFAKYRSADEDDSVAGSGFTTTTLPANQVEVNTDPLTQNTIDEAAPHAVLRRTFTTSVQPVQLYLSLDLSDLAGAIVYLNSAKVASLRVPGSDDTPTATVPGLGFDPLFTVFSLPVNTLPLGANVITVQLYSRASGPLPVNVKLEASVSTYDPATQPPGWFPVDVAVGDIEGALSPSGKTYVGKLRHVVEGSTPRTLSDNWFTMRYREKKAVNDDTGWSTWTDAQLVEGWIKRVLAGINPFNQRVTDLLNNPVNTDVSLLTQAGARWEGDIALTLGNINDVGLIQIYETVLGRGGKLSINGTPRINDPAVNSALLLAAGYLSDLYTLLGNEAFADAANPTIAVGPGPDGNFGDVTTSLFAFQGQVPNVLEEELDLLRGRDDFLAPGTKTAPIYNRLVWNYTRGILAGEAVYAVNYNIKDVNFDGKIDAADAAKLFPQGHGDAYGHYLSALTGYYRLLTNDFFSWQPRSESVLVLGTPVAVDYFDERKFAGAALNVARAASQTLDLTYRKAFTATENGGWQNLRDLQAGQPVTNPQTLVTRSWGVDDWACRGGQGAFFNWVTANSGLPDVDPNPAHEGIQKIDRTTVPELAAITEQANAIQQTLDHADQRLNPLGLSRGVLSFDIAPAAIDAGQTHFEQIRGRAVAALQNAVDAFNSAKTSTQFLRAQEENLESLRAAISEQEQAYENQLIDIYGTPYPEDIGPGRTYTQDYAGPDLAHALYIDSVERFDNGSLQTFAVPLDPKSQQMTFATTQSDPDTAYMTLPVFAMDTINLSVDRAGIPFKPTGFVGKRAHPGRVQSATSALLTARLQLLQAASDYRLADADLKDRLGVVNSAIEQAATLEGKFDKFESYRRDLKIVIASLTLAGDVLKGIGDQNSSAADAIVEYLPKVVGLATDATSGARGAAKTTSFLANQVLRVSGQIVKGSANIAEAALSKAEGELNESLREGAWVAQHRQLLYDLRLKLRTLVEKQGAIDVALRGMDDASRNLDTTVAEGLRIQKDREVARERSAAIIQGYRTRDLAFRAFRNEALEKYKTLFDLAARYTFLAARSYDFETGLLDYAGNSKATAFFDQIVRARAPGVLINGQPQFGGSGTGDPGLAGVLAQLDGDWSVAKTRLGFNNPDRYRTTFSLRSELLRILPSSEGDAAWKESLDARVMENILDDPDVRRYCAQAGDPTGLPQPGIVIEFPSTVTTGYNFFGQLLAGGDHNFSPTSFATKIRAAGVAFAGYVGMDSPSSTSALLSGIGAASPPSPTASFSDPDSLSATPYIYLVPAGADSLRAPPLGDSTTIRSWQVEDQAIPLPFDISGTDFATRKTYVSSDSLSEPPFAIRKHQAFRAVPAGTVFSSDPGFTNARLIGRSVWNSRWKLIIPGSSLLNDPKKGVDIFTKTVKDIQLHLESYSYSGN